MTTIIQGPQRLSQIELTEVCVSAKIKLNCPVLSDANPIAVQALPRPNSNTGLSFFRTSFHPGFYRSALAWLSLNILPTISGRYGDEAPGMVCRTDKLRVYAQVPEECPASTCM